MNRAFNMTGRAPVARSADFLRVQRLPVRTDATYPPTLVEQLSRLLKTPTAAEKERLRVVQAKALFDFYTYGFVFTPLKVGAGKTLLSFLLPRVANAQRPLLILPAKLIEKTQRELDKATKDWQVARHLRIWSYEILGRVSGAQKLDTLKPDMIIADEAHKLKNPKAAVTRRVARYMQQNPGTKFVPMSGTIMKKSIKDFAHLMEWAMGQNAPVPLYAATLLEWSEALDEGANPLIRRDPGVLLDLYPGAYADNGSFGDDNNRRARRVFQARCQATPGVVVADSTDDYTGSLQVEGREYEVNGVTEANFKKLRDTACRPDGWALTESAHIWAVARQLALGLHYEWDPAPPDAWLNARKAWAAFVRDFLAKPSSSAAGIDSELQVANGVLHGDIEDEYGVLAEWQRLKPTFTINPKDVWHDDSALRMCASWLAEHPKGICWTEHAFFGKELSRITGLPYFGAQGLDSKGNFIEDATGPIIASRAANSEGRNVQYKWCDNLVTAPSSDSEIWEQLIGRTHRSGQPEDEVTVDVLIGCREHLESIPRALNSSDVKTDLWGFTQKLRLADIEWPAMTGRRGARWS